MFERCHDTGSRGHTTADALLQSRRRDAPSTTRPACRTLILHDEYLVGAATTEMLCATDRSTPGNIEAALLSRIGVF